MTFVACHKKIQYKHKNPVSRPTCDIFYPLVSLVKIHFLCIAGKHTTSGHFNFGVVLLKIFIRCLHQIYFQVCTKIAVKTDSASSVFSKFESSGIPAVPPFQFPARPTWKQISETPRQPGHVSFGDVIIRRSSRWIKSQWIKSRHWIE